MLLVITDGRDNASTVTMQQIEQLSRQSETAVYTVGLFGNATGRSEGRPARTRRTDETNRRRCDYPSSIDQIDAIAADLAHQIRSQYTIAYTPTDQALDGSYRRIRVEARGREALTVQTRAGYVASPQTQTVR